MTVFSHEKTATSKTNILMKPQCIAICQNFFSSIVSFLWLSQCSKQLEIHECTNVKEHLFSEDFKSEQKEPLEGMSSTRCKIFLKFMITKTGFFLIWLSSTKKIRVNLFLCIMLFSSKHG